MDRISSLKEENKNLKGKAKSRQEASPFLKGGLHPSHVLA
jgi:hypothetical protein